jgi:hypothetical protein
MSRLKSLKSANIVHDQVSPMTAWASVVSILAAEKKKAELEFKRRIKQQVVNQQTSSRRRKKRADNKKASSSPRTQQTAE